MGLFCLLALALAILANFIQSPEKELRDKARRKAESLAYQLIEIERGPKAQSRGPASTGPRESLGQIGKDPWGQPYEYHVSKQDTDLYLKVISRGPDQADSGDDVIFEINFE